MQYIYAKSFQKHFNKLPFKQQSAARDAINLFMQDPKASSLRNHRLKGRFRHIWSISAGGDLRIHYTITRNGNIIITFVDVGTHSQLY
jgi:addiction module RelE/StbE family toxin